MPARRAAIFVQHDRPHPDRQETLALRYAETAGLAVVALCSNPDNCLAIVRSDAVDVIVTALSTDLAFVEAVEAAGGRVVVVRPDPPRGDVAQMVVTMYHRSGGDVGLIADLLGETTGEVRARLARAGIRAPRRR